jgi:hypothetical protein
MLQDKSELTLLVLPLKKSTLQPQSNLPGRSPAKNHSGAGIAGINNASATTGGGSSGLAATATATATATAAEGKVFLQEFFWPDFGAADSVARVNRLRYLVTARVPLAIFARQ